jgi:hypothetical protein
MIPQFSRALVDSDSESSSTLPMYNTSSVR